MNPRRHEISSNRLSHRQRATRGLEKHPALIEWIKVFLSTQPLPGPKSGWVALTRRLPDGTLVSVKIKVYEPDPRYDPRTDWAWAAKREAETRFRDRRNVMMPPHDHLLAEWVTAFVATGPKPNWKGWVWWRGTVDGRLVKVSAKITDDHMSVMS